MLDPLFRDEDFLDPRDLVQVKYEMLRRARLEGRPVSHCAADFGFSRPTFYAAQRAFEELGIVGLVPAKRGPRGGHKLTAEVIRYLDGLLDEDRNLASSTLAERLRTAFGLEVDPRSIERALERRGKKRR